MDFFSVISAGLLVAQLILALMDKQEAPALLDYRMKSRPNLDPWRWRQPDVRVGIAEQDDRGLQLFDTENASHLRFPKRFFPAEALVQLIGYGFLGLTLVLGLGTLSDPTNWEVKLIGLGLFGAIGLLCVRCSSQVTQIDLYPDRADLVVKYGFFFHRKHRIRPHRRLRFKQMQRTWLNRDWRKSQPHFEIVIVFPLLWVLKLERRFSLACTLAQESWIVGGLNHWNAVAYKNRRA